MFGTLVIHCPQHSKPDSTRMIKNRTNKKRKGNGNLRPKSENQDDWTWSSATSLKQTVCTGKYP